MKPKKLISVFILIIILLSVAYDNIYTKKIIAGIYVYNFSSTIADGPQNGAFLALKNNGQFESDTWGNGTYELNFSKLVLKYKYANGNAEFTCKVRRPMFWGSPRIEIDNDLNYYFKKTN